MVVAEEDPHEVRHPVHHLVDDAAEALAEAQVEDQHEEAVEVDGSPASTSTSHDLSTRQS